MENKIEILNFNQFKNRHFAVNEGSNPNAKHEYGCIMASHNFVKLYNDIDPEDVYDTEDGSHGIETEPHITLCYGLHDEEIDKAEVILLLQSLIIPKVTLTEINLFENEKFDVLKYEIGLADKLSLINKIITSIFPYTTNYPDYHAHSTIAYLKPGTGKKYVKKLDQPVDLFLNRWIYSQANGEKLSILNDVVEILRKKNE